MLTLFAFLEKGTVMNQTELLQQLQQKAQRRKLLACSLEELRAQAGETLAKLEQQADNARKETL